MPRLIRNTTVLFKSESTYGIDAMPTADDGVLVLTGVDFQPDFRFVDRTVARPGLGASPSLMGAQIAKLDLAFELAGPEAMTAPAWDPLIKALGFNATTLTNPDRVEYTPISVGHISGTAYVYSDGVLYKVVGCLGAGSIEIEAGNTPKVRASLQGLYVGEYVGTTPVPAMANWKAPVVVSKANVTDLNLGCAYAAGAFTGGTIYASRGMTIDLGNQVEYIEMCSNDFMAITQRTMKAQITMDLSATQEVSFIGRMRAGTLGSQGFIVGNKAGNTILLHMPAGQFSAPRITDVSGVRLMQFESTLTPTGAGDDELRITCLLGTTGSGSGSGGGGGGGGAVPDANEPVIADFAPYKTSATTWVGVPFYVDAEVKQRSWSETALGGAAKTEFDLFLPSGTPPAGGWPVLMMLHRQTNSGFRNWLLAGSPEAAVKDSFLAAGYAIVNGEYAQPATTLGSLPAGTPAPFDDAGRLTQRIRSIATAFNLNPNDITAYGRSRGCMGLYAALAPDLKDTAHASHAYKQSSRPTRVFVMDGQATWRPDQFGELYVQVADRASLNSQYPTDARLKARPSLYELVSSSTFTGRIYFQHSAAWNNRLLTLSEAQAADQNHYPDAGRVMLDAFVAAGKRNQIVVNYGVPVGDTGMALAWVNAIRTIPATGITPAPSAAELAAIVEAKRSGINLYYCRNDASGLALNADGSGAVAQGQPIQACADGGEGLANRLAGAAAVGSPAVMGTSANRPLAGLQGSNWVFDFGATGVMQVARANTAVDVWIATPYAWESGFISKTAALYKWGKASTKIGLAAAAVNGTVGTQQAVLFKQFATEIMGTAYPLI